MTFFLKKVQIYHLLKYIKDGSSRLNGMIECLLSHVHKWYFYFEKQKVVFTECVCLHHVHDEKCAYGYYA